jgi:hypothetical protein
VLGDFVGRMEADVLLIPAAGDYGLYDVQDLARP